MTGNRSSVAGSTRHDPQASDRSAK